MRKEMVSGRKTIGRIGPTRRVWQGMVMAGLVLGLLVGCVSSEKYEAEKARALNFQRLLAQEEKRTGELNVQVQEARRQTAALESQNKDLTTELQALREQMSRAQEELDRTRIGASEMKEAGAEDLTLSESSLSEFGLSDMGFEDTDFTDFGTGEGLGTSEGLTYTVVKGDTLYRISREHGVTVDDLKRWNNLTNNTISVGQKLIVNP